MYHTPDPETLSAEGGTPDVENSSQDSNAEPSGATDPDVGSDADSRLAPVTDSAYALGYDDADAAVAGQPVRNRPKRRSVSAETGSSGEPNGQVAGEEAASPYSMQRVMEETIAQLQAALQQKDEELLQTTLAATNFKETLEQTKTRSEHLRKKLTTVVKAHETLSQKVASGAVPIVNGGRAVPESEVAQMKEQWRVAQKSFEREHNRIRGELAKTRTQAHQVAQELEVQTRARRAEEAHASLRVANLERNLQTAKTVVAAEESQSGSWMKLAATAVVASGRRGGCPAGTGSRFRVASNSRGPCDGTAVCIALCDIAAFARKKPGAFLWRDERRTGRQRRCRPDPECRHYVARRFSEGAEPPE
jgi:hypothetical protein